MSAKTLALVLSTLLVIFAVLSVRVGSTDLLDGHDMLQGALAMIGLADDLPEFQSIARLRILRLLVSIAVGASLALSGGLLQGVFRNDLASPGIIGVSSGASLGAAVAILGLGGYGPTFFLQDAVGVAPFVVTIAALVGALLTAWLVTALATTGGRISVPTLLLCGIAMNAFIGGLIAAIQSFAVGHYEVAQALFSWLFGRLHDRTLEHVGIAWGGLVLAAASIPFVGVELDLLAAGEEDAAGLGVDIQRVKVRALVAAALAAAFAVAVVGQIAFVGLVVPHLIRRIAAPTHRALLLLCLLGGPVLLIGADLAQRLVFQGDRLPPGVAMSLIGGPFFLWLLVRNRRMLRTW